MQGEYRHTIDAKGRINFPVKFREILTDSFVLTRGMDNCIVVYHQEEWDKVMEKLAASTQRSRNMRRKFMSGVCNVETDKQGRIIIPQNLRSYAELEKDVVVIGLGNCVEIWDANRFDVLMNEIDDDEMAEMMDELGINI